MNARPPRALMRALLVVSVAAIAAACAKKEDAAAPTGAAEKSAAETAAPEAEPMVEAETGAADAAPIGSANVTVTMTNGQPAFGAVGEGFCITGGACMGGINLNAAGDIDLSWFPPGDVTINIALDSSATGAGYSLPGDPYQAVAIAVIPPGTVTAPIPVFGQANWPAEFDAPSVSNGALSFVDKEDEQDGYEYSIQLQGPGGLVVMDPKITNGGGGNKEPLPEPPAQ